MYVEVHTKYTTGRKSFEIYPALSEKMIRILLVILLFCSACASTKVTEKCDTEKETKKECCSKK